MPQNPVRTQTGKGHATAIANAMAVFYFFEMILIAGSHDLKTFMKHFFKLTMKPARTQKR